MPLQAPATAAALLADAAGGLVSQFFLPFALTVTFALLASLICALTVVPVLAFLFIKKVNVKAS